MNPQNIAAHISGSTCGGPAPEWKCPGCGTEARRFDPMHWRNCARQAKMQARCQKCRQAESACSCAGA